MLVSSIRKVPAPLNVIVPTVAISMSEPKSTVAPETAVAVIEFALEAAIAPNVITEPLVNAFAVIDVNAAPVAVISPIVISAASDALAVIVVSAAATVPIPIAPVSVIPESLSPAAVRVIAVSAPALVRTISPTPRVT